EINEFVVKIRGSTCNLLFRCRCFFVCADIDKILYPLHTNRKSICKRGACMSFIETYQWEIFIVLEVISWISLFIFGVLRYFFDKRKLSMYFLILFVTFIGVEALLGWFIYIETGELSTIQLVITIFVIYA